MDEMLQNKLLKVLEDKRAFFESAYYDPTDEKVPPYIRKLFEEGAPADFVLIGATTRDAGHINPALRSRCAEIYFEPLTPKHIQQIVQNAAAKLHVTMDEGVSELISEYTIEGRKAINILADAYSLALEKCGAADSVPVEQIARGEGPAVTITKAEIYEVAQVSRLYQFVKKKASDKAVQGHVFGLGVAGFLGSVIEIEAVAFEAHEKGKGTVRFNETAGSMAKDSVFNAASVMRRLTGKDIHDYDIHINVIGGGNIDGPSAGTAILAVLTSAVTGRKIRQDVAVTGEISLQGRVRPVGGVFEKAYGAKQAGIKTLIIPKENDKDKGVLSAVAGFYLLKGDYINAIQSVRKILIQDQADVDALKNLGMIYFKKNDAGLASMVTTNSYNLKSDDAGIANNRGVLYSAQNDDSLAMLYFTRAIANDPKNKSANFNVGSIAMKYGDAETAYERFSVVLSQDPDNLNARIGLAMALRGLGRFEDAEKEYLAVLQKDHQAEYLLEQRKQA